GIVPGENVIRDAPRIRIADLLDLSQVDMPDQMRPKVAPKLLAALLADRKDLHRLASSQKLPGMQAHELDDRRVEPAAEATLGTGDDQKMPVLGPRTDQQLRRRRAARDARCEIAEHGFHA